MSSHTMNSQSLSPTLRACFHLVRPGFTLDADFECPAEGITAVAGPSGAGKSTLLRCLAGLEPRAQGHFQCGPWVWQSREHFTPPHRRDLGFVFQRPMLFDHLNVEQNIGYGLLRTQVPAAQRNARITAITKTLSIEDLLYRNPSTLSGGQQQRVSLARALVLQPKLLLLDEPTTGLDDTLKQDFFELLLVLQKEFRIPMIMVTHSVTDIRKVAQHLVHMVQGRVTSSGPLTESASMVTITGRWSHSNKNSEESTNSESRAPNDASWAGWIDYETEHGTIPVWVSPRQRNRETSPLATARREHGTQPPRPGDEVTALLDTEPLSLALHKPDATALAAILPGRIVQLTRQEDSPWVDVSVTTGPDLFRLSLSHAHVTALGLELLHKEQKEDNEHVVFLLVPKVTLLSGPP